MTQEYDVVVVGAGNAGLCAALAAQETGARVLVLEKAPVEERGGNTAFTGGLLRFPFESIDDFRPLVPDFSEDELAGLDVGRYTKRDYANDLDRVTEELSDPDMVEILTGQAYQTMRWMRERGVRWLFAIGRQSYLDPSTAKRKFFGNLILEANGGGQGLSDYLFTAIEKGGIDVAYETKAVRLLVNDQGTITGIQVRDTAGQRAIRSRAVVLAAGGFEANREMRTRYLGPDWELAKVRGTRFNTGDGIRMALEIGAQPFGHWSCCHAVAWNLMAGDVGDRTIGDLHQKHSYPIGIIVNRDGKRFVDEGADFRNYTYAKYGREILKQPRRQAFQIFDRKTLDLLRDEYGRRDEASGRIPPYVTKVKANTIDELADGLMIDPVQLKRTVDEFNAAIQPGDFNPSILDGKHTEGITPPKSNWAISIDEPPFEGYAVTCGITFTFGGLRINKQGQVLDTEDHPLPGLYAAGELVGGLFYYNYPGGSGLMAGAVFGRLAGTSAAKAATG